MKIVQELYDEMWSHKDVTTALTIKKAINGLLGREEIYRSTPLSDNVIDLIIGELRNAVSEEGDAMLFTALNMLAPPEAQVGALNPVESATRLLSTMKCGQQATIAPELAADFNPPFGLVIHGQGKSAVFLSLYRTTEFEVRGGLVPEILSVTERFPAGVLVFQGSDADLPQGIFYPCDESAYEASLGELTAKSFDEDPDVARGLLMQAVEQLESGNPVFIAKRPEACSPRPNFMKKEEWPKIAALIRTWLAEHS